MTSPKTVFIDWRPHNGRASSLAADLGATLYLAPPVLRSKLAAPLRYVYLALRTLRILSVTRPEVVIASSPPSFSPLVIFLYSRVARCRYVVDAHHRATIGLWAQLPLGLWLNRLVMNRAAATLVHNERIQELVAARGIRSLVLETKTAPVEPLPPSTADPFTILVPCSFDSDEPIDVIVEAARQLPAVRFYCTGDAARAPHALTTGAPANIVLPGFVPQAEYRRLLATAHAVLVLSTDDYPLRPRGASEAIGATKPLIVTRNAATEAHIAQGAVLVRNTADEVRHAILAIQRDYARYVREMTALREERMRQYALELRALQAVL